MDLQLQLRLFPDDRLQLVAVLLQLQKPLGNGLHEHPGPVSQQRIEALSREEVKRGRPPVRVGIGIHTGSVVVGNLGSGDFLQYTYIGPDVNLTARVQSLTKEFGHALLLTERTAQQIGEAWPVKRLGEANVRGFDKPVTLYTVTPQGVEVTYQDKLH